MDAREEQSRKGHDASGNDLPEQLGLRPQIVDIIDDTHAEHDEDANRNTDPVDLVAEPSLKRCGPTPKVRTYQCERESSNHTTEDRNTAHTGDGLHVHTARARIVDRIERNSKPARKRREHNGNAERNRKENDAFDPIQVGETLLVRVSIVEGANSALKKGTIRNQLL